jgi:hypothetical protein
MENPSRDHNIEEVQLAIQHRRIEANQGRTEAYKKATEVAKQMGLQNNWSNRKQRMPFACRWHGCSCRSAP